MIDLRTLSAGLLVCAVLVFAGGADAQPVPTISVEGTNAAGARVLDQVADDSNIVLSPLSLGIAIAMSEAGATGDTRKALSGFIGAAATDVGLPATDLIARLSISDKPEDPKLSLANALFITRDNDLISNDYKRLLEDSFEARVFQGARLDDVNAWVAKETDGLIDTLLEGLDPNSVCVLANAVHFTGAWRNSFSPDATAPGAFTLDSGEQVRVDFMNRTGDMAIAEDANYAAVALPYAQNRFAMAILVEKEGRAKRDSKPVLSSSQIEPVISELIDGPMARTSLSMPKFEIETELDLVDVLKRLDLVLPFDSNRAEFGRMLKDANEESRLHISQMRQKAVIEVDEFGTKAAAATAVEFAIRSLQRDPVEFVVDRPFVFALFDIESRAILFLGRVADPSR